MWFHFAPDKGGRSQLFYGFPTLPWGPPNVTRISVDAATARIKDPSERRTNVVNPEDVRDTQDFVKQHVVGVDSTVPAFTSTCLQTNVFGVYFCIIRGLKMSIPDLAMQTTCSFLTTFRKSISVAGPRTVSCYSRRDGR